MNKTEALNIIERKDAVCVVWDDEQTYTSSDRGIKPLLKWINQDKDFFKGKSIVDKVIGKAAALLFVYGGALTVHALVISKHALTVFEQHNVSVTYDTLTDYIVNRDNTGMCPMESRVLGIDSPKEAYLNLSELL